MGVYLGIAIAWLPAVLGFAALVALGLYGVGIYTNWHFLWGRGSVAAPPDQV